MSEYDTEDKPGTGYDEHIIDTKGVKVNFGDFWALKGIDIKVKKGEIIVILGPSGSGKSTYIRTLNRLQPHSGGTVEIDGITVDDDTTVADMKYIRAEIGFVFQQFNLFPHLTIMENITLAPMKVKGMPKREAEDKAMALLEKVGIPEQAYKYPSGLSGGQQQRVAIARALAMDPKIMLFDEPTSALDPEMIKEVLDVMIDLAKEDVTMIVVTHEMGFAMAVADRVILFDEGELVEQNTPAEFFDNPQHERTKLFLEQIL
ncbi:MAG: amino acid ABC transporter ATP-binding protein [Marine Group II euryarchaeote MED-G34]|nr:MAG: amino acid ABC transporter ATP-binding protein [Marine Group II euryarchaeote MED-G34]